MFKAILPRGMGEDTFNAKLKGVYTPAALKAMAPAGVLYSRGQELRPEAVANMLHITPMRRNGAGRGRGIWSRMKKVCRIRSISNRGKT